MASQRRGSRTLRGTTSDRISALSTDYSRTAALLLITGFHVHYPICIISGANAQNVMNVMAIYHSSSRFARRPGSLIRSLLPCPMQQTCVGFFVTSPQRFIAQKGTIGSNVVIHNSFRNKNLAQLSSSSDVIESEFGASWRMECNYPPGSLHCCQPAKCSLPAS